MVFGAVRQRNAAVLDVLRNHDLRLLQFGWGAFFVIEWTSLVALSVWAYQQGGASAIGLVGLARLLPGAIALPLGALAADRFSRRTLVAGVFLSMAVIHAALALAMGAGASAGVVYALVGLSSVVAAPYRPAHLALVPLLARTPQELVASNVTAGALEGIAAFAGPAIAGVVLLNTSPWVVLAISAGAAVAGCAALAGIRPTMDPSKSVGSAPEGALTALVGGLSAIRKDADSTLLVGCIIAQLFVRGLLTVLLTLLSFDLLDLGKSGVGWLAAAMGIGGILGAALAVVLTGRRQLGFPFALGLALWGLPIALIGAVPRVAVAYLALAVIGIGNSLVDVAGMSLLQRLGEDRSLGRIFGVLYAFGIALAGLGSLLVPPAVATLGLRQTMLVVGAVLPVVAVLALPRIRQLDRRSQPPAEVLAIIARIPLLAPLPPTTLEKIAYRCSLRHVAAGATVILEGEAAADFYAIADGDLEVTQAGILRKRLGRGDHFGEIALLRGSTRTATVRAVSDARLVVLTRADFLDCVSGSAAAHAVATRQVDDLLAYDATAQRS